MKKLLSYFFSYVNLATIGGVFFVIIITQKQVNIYHYLFTLIILELLLYIMTITKNFYYYRNKTYLNTNKTK